MSRGTCSLLACLAAVVLSARLARAEEQGRTRLGLDEAVELALRNHPVLQQARASVAVASARTTQARAGYLPQITATGQVQRTTDNTVPRRPGAATDWDGTTYNRFAFGGTASQLVYDFGQTSGRWSAAESSQEAAQHTAEAQGTQIVTAVRRTYFAARAQEDLAAVARAALTNQEKHLQQSSRLVEQGLRPEIDRLSNETNVANARVQLIAAENAFDLACTLFAQALGLPATPGYAPANDDFPPLPQETLTTPALVEEALGNRRELAAFVKQRQAQEALISAARGGLGPSLYAQANVSAGGAELGHLVPNWGVGALLNWPLFQGGATTGQVREARANLELLHAQEETFRLSVRVDVEQAALNVRAARATLEAAQVALASARKQLQLAESRYAAGLGSVIELGDSQVQATQAAAQEVNARYALASARATLRGALGAP